MNGLVQGSKRWYFQARMVALSMAASVLLYGGLGYFLVESGKVSPVRPDGKIYALLKYGGVILAVVIFIAAWKLSGRMLKALADQPAPRPPQRFFAASVLRNAAAEMAAVLGLVLIFLSGDFRDFLPFGVLSLVGFAVAFPRKRKWAEWTGEDA